MGKRGPGAEPAGPEAGRGAGGDQVPARLRRSYRSMNQVFVGFMRTGLGDVLHRDAGVSGYPDLGTLVTRQGEGAGWSIRSSTSEVGRTSPKLR